MHKLAFIQIMRAVAANLVVLCHIAGVDQKFFPSSPLLPGFFGDLGSLGVQIFFVISGFVIIQAARRETWGEFAYARLTRIYPIYWIFTTVMVLGYTLMPAQLADRSGVSLIASFALWPAKELPLLVVGWTLIHEMYFYVVVTAVIALRIKPIYALLAWGAIITICQLIEMPNWPAINLATNPLTFLFILGALLSLLLPISLFKTGGGWLVLLGDASYSTYLSHVLCISALWRLGMMVGAPRPILMAISFVASNAVGVLSFRYLERPILKLAKMGLPALRQRPLGM